MLRKTLSKAPGLKTCHKMRLEETAHLVLGSLLAHKLTPRGSL